jgi:tetratricopeptide (TPR) repeat protein
LIQVSDQSHLWAQNYQRDVKDILSVQTDVARAIADKVQVKLNPQPEAPAAGSQPRNAQAYDDYLEGRYAWNERTVASMTKGVEYFERAIEQNPNYAAAYAGMAECYTLLAMDRVPNPRELLAKAKTAALRAVELDDSSAEAHVALGGVRVFADFDWPGAEAEFKRAIALNPNNAQAHHWYANLFLDPQGRYDEAIAEMQQAQALDPLSLIINTDLGYAYYVAGRNDEAADQFRKVMAMDPNFVPAVYDLSLLDLRRNDEQAAWRNRLAALRISGQPELLAKIEQAYKRAGFRGVEQDRAASQGTFGLRNYPKSAWEAAYGYAYLGEKDKAISFLEASYEERNPAIIYLRCDPSWTSLRAEPRFQELERKLGLVQ